MSENEPIIDETEDERSSKSMIINYISFLLPLMAKNYTKNQCVKALIAEYPPMVINQAYRYYLKATEQLQDDLDEKIKAIRNRRIHSLHKDIQDAFSNYTAATEPNLQLKWFDQYTKLKQILDGFYPNSLKPDGDNDNLSINISYNRIKKEGEHNEDL